MLLPLRLSYAGGNWCDAQTPPSSSQVLTRLGKGNEKSPLRHWKLSHRAGSASHPIQLAHTLEVCIKRAATCFPSGSPARDVKSGDSGKFLTSTLPSLASSPEGSEVCYLSFPHAINTRFDVCESLFRKPLIEPPSQCPLGFHLKTCPHLHTPPTQDPCGVEAAPPLAAGAFRPLTLAQSCWGEHAQYFQGLTQTPKSKKKKKKTLLLGF